MSEEEDEAYDEYDASKAEAELDDETRMEKMRDDQEDQAASQYGFPTGKEKQTVFSFFKKIISLRDSSKVANVTKYELGAPSLTIRAWQDLALYCAVENLDIVANYCMAQNEIILATSLSKDGFLDTLAVSQKREIARGPKPGGGQPTTEEQQPKKKWSWGKQKAV